MNVEPPAEGRAWSASVRLLPPTEIHYGSTWEDHELVEAALEVHSDDDVLTVASAGCSALAMLLAGARSVTAVDDSPAQAALTALKVAAVRELEYDDYVALLGFRDAPDRLALYGRARRWLPGFARAYWDARVRLLVPGLLRAGRFERYLDVFRRKVLHPLWSEDSIAKLFAARSLEAQRCIYELECRTSAFEALFRWHAGMEALALARAPELSQQLRCRDPGTALFLRFDRVFTQHSLRTNPYAELVLTGQISDLDVGPPHLRRANYANLRDCIDGVRVVVCDFERFLASAKPGSFSKVNLGDALESMTEAKATRIHALLGDKLRVHGRSCHFGMSNDDPPLGTDARIASRSELARALQRNDRLWFHDAFHVVEKTR